MTGALMALVRRDLHLAWRSPAGIAPAASTSAGPGPRAGPAGGKPAWAASSSITGAIALTQGASGGPSSSSRLQIG